MEKRQVNCFNCSEHGGHCKYFGHYQAGGGTTSPGYSYIFCKYSSPAQKVLMQPRIPKQGEWYDAFVELPDVCILKDSPRREKLF